VLLLRWVFNDGWNEFTFLMETVYPENLIVVRYASRLGAIKRL
jgi:hypothetical protein